MRRFSRLATVGLTGLILLGTSAAAEADQSSITDKRADVLVGPLFDEDGDEFRRMNAEESRASGIDIKSGRFKHGKKTVTVTLRFARLKSDSFMITEFYVPGRKKAAFTLQAATGNTTAMVMRGHSEDKVCSAKFRSRKGKNGSMTATIKRSCLGNPAKVRMATTAFRWYYDGPDALSAGDALSAKKVQSPQKTPFLRSN